MINFKIKKTFQGDKKAHKKTWSHLNSLKESHFLNLSMFVCVHVKLLIIIAKINILRNKLKIFEK